MASKKVRVGNLLVNEITDKTTGQKKNLISIGLGNKGNNPKYNSTVEITVKDAEGNVVAHQTNGFLELIDPRTQPDELLAASIISEEMAEKMKESASKLPDMIRYNVMIKG